MRLFLKLLITIFLQFFIFCSHSYAFEEEKCKILPESGCFDYGKKVINGVETDDLCWDDVQKSICIGKEQNHCSNLETNRGCNELTAKCLENSEVDLCKNMEKKFSCGSKLEEKAEVKHINTQFHVIKDEKDLSSCSADEINQYCEVINEACIEPKETRNINGKLVEKDCWKWKKQYACRSNNLVDECKVLGSNCKLGEQKCLHALKINNKEECDHWEVKYSCENQIIRKKECIAKQFCLGGVCETNQRTQYSDFAESVGSLAVLTAMKSDEIDGCKCPNGRKTCEPGEVDTTNCKLFTGNANQCHKSTAQQNCCSDKGFIRDLFDCSQEEKDLFIKRTAGLCHHVGSWNGDSLEDKVTFTSYQSHCCFKSKLAKIIQVGGREQLGISWGDEENPNCRALSLEEIRKINFSKLDFSEMFNEFKEKAYAKAESMKQDMQNNSELVRRKVNKFYGGAAK
jgi:conjugal transfer mating pair stabilization protein TraN